MLRLRDEAWAQAQGIKSSTDWQIFRQLRNTCVRAVKNAKSCYFVDTLSDCCGNPSNLLKTIKSLNHDHSYSQTKHFVTLHALYEK